MIIFQVPAAKVDDAFTAVVLGPRAWKERGHSSGPKQQDS